MGYNLSAEQLPAIWRISSKSFPSSNLLTIKLLSSLSWLRSIEYLTEISSPDRTVSSSIACSWEDPSWTRTRCRLRTIEQKSASSIYSWHPNLKQFTTISLTSPTPPEISWKLLGKSSWSTSTATPWLSNQSTEWREIRAGTQIRLDERLLSFQPDRSSSTSMWTSTIKAAPSKPKRSRTPRRVLKAWRKASKLLH